MTTEEKIKELENSCRTAMAEIERLKTELAEKNENKTVWLPNNGDEYTYINEMGLVGYTLYLPTMIDKRRKSSNNIYHSDNKTEERLKWYCDNVFRVQNKLMQLHELLCPDYFPDWKNSDEPKYYLVYSTKGNEWTYTYLYIISSFVVYFTEESAQKACEILNREKFMME